MTPWTYGSRLLARIKKLESPGVPPPVALVSCLHIHLPHLKHTVAPRVITSRSPFGEMSPSLSSMHSFERGLKRQYASSLLWSQWAALMEQMPKRPAVGPAAEPPSPYGLGPAALECRAHGARAGLVVHSQPRRPSMHPLAQRVDTKRPRRRSGHDEGAAGVGAEGRHGPRVPRVRGHGQVRGGIPLRRRRRRRRHRWPRAGHRAPGRREGTPPCSRRPQAQRTACRAPPSARGR
jgi:hypothetical protein